MTYGIGRTVPVHCFSDKASKDPTNNSTTALIYGGGKYITLPTDLTQRCSIEFAVAATEWADGKDADYILSIHDDGGSALSTAFDASFAVAFNEALDAVEKSVTVSADLFALAVTNKLSATAYHNHQTGSQIRIRTFVVRMIARMP